MTCYLLSFHLKGAIVMCHNRDICFEATTKTLLSNTEDNLAVTALNIFENNEAIFISIYVLIIYIVISLR